MRATVGERCLKAKSAVGGVLGGGGGGGGGGGSPPPDGPITGGVVAVGS